MSETSATLAYRFDRLCELAADCRLCPDLAGRSAVLSARNGALNPRVLFVAEAPGRQGADRTRIPFHGDASGATFERLMSSIGLVRNEVFITNAVLCSPRNETGANRAPKSSEIRNCSSFLRETIGLLEPPLVAAIGATALAACGLIADHGMTLARDVGKCRDWFSRRLMPLYHPSPQVLVSRRSIEQQMEDWQALKAELLPS